MIPRTAAHTAGVLGAGGLALAPLPAWCVFTCVLGLIALAGLQIVMPQNSKDRLTFWTHRREHRAQRRAVVAGTVESAGRPQS